MKRCTACGQMHQDDHRFCRFCGSILEAVPERTAPPGNYPPQSANYNQFRTSPPLDQPPVQPAPPVNRPSAQPAPPVNRPPVQPAPPVNRPPVQPPPPANWPPVQPPPPTPPAAPPAAPRRRRWPLFVIIGVLAAALVVTLILLIPRLLDGGEPEQRPSVSSEAPRPVKTPRPTAEPTPVPEATAAPAPEPGSDTMPLGTACQSVFYLEMYDGDDDYIGCASGFILGDNETLITNYHVVQDARSICAWTPDGEHSAWVTNIMAYDAVNDLAVVRLEKALPGEPLRLADSDATAQGDQVYAVGYPLGVVNSMSNGIISARYEDENGVDTIQVTAAIARGNSGGPLLNEAGQVIGVICAYYTEAQNMNLAVSSNTLQKLLNTAGRGVPLKDWENRPLRPGQDVPAPSVGPTGSQKETHARLYQWIEDNANEVMGDGSLVYSEDISTDDLIMIWELWADVEGTVSVGLIAQDPETEEEYRLYVILEAEWDEHMLLYFYYEDYRSVEEDYFGGAYLDPATFAVSGYPKFEETDGYVYDPEGHEDLAGTMAEEALWLLDLVMIEELSLSLTDYGFTFLN